MRYGRVLGAVDALAVVAQFDPDPVGSFVYGVLALLVVIVVFVVVVLTLIGTLVAIPLAILSSLTWAVGAAIAYLAIGERPVGRDDGLLAPRWSGPRQTAGPP